MVELLTDKAEVQGSSPVRLQFFSQFFPPSFSFVDYVYDN